MALFVWERRALVWELMRSTVTSRLCGRISQWSLTIGWSRVTLTLGVLYSLSRCAERTQCVAPAGAALVCVLDTSAPPLPALSARLDVVGCGGRQRWRLITFCFAEPRWATVTAVTLIQ